MSNIIAFPINHLGAVSTLGEIDTLALERMEAVRDQIEGISNFLIAIQDELAKIAAPSVGLSQTANTSLPVERGWA